MSAGEEATIMMGGKQLPEENPVERAPPKAKLVCLDTSLLDPPMKDLVILLEGKELILGRDKKNTPPIPCGKVSSRHARIYPVEGLWGVEDLESTNGIAINDKVVQKARLRPGDYLKIGPVMFRFVLQRPDAVLEPVATVSPNMSEVYEPHGTLFVTEEKAADMLMASEKAGQRSTQQASKQTSSVPSSQRGGPIPPPKKASGWKWLLVLLILGAIGGGGFWGYTHYMASQVGTAELILHQKAIKNFVTDYEDTSKNFTAGDLRLQLAEIIKLRNVLETDSVRFPQTPGYTSLRVRLLFFGIERDIYLLIMEQKSKDAEQLLDAASTAIGRWSKTPGDVEGETSIQDLMELLSLMRDVIKIKIFKERFPLPSAKATVKPSMADIAGFFGLHQRFLEKKKASKINMMLSLQYPFFMRMVTRVDEDDLQVLPLWKEYVR